MDTEALRGTRTQAGSAPGYPTSNGLASDCPALDAVATAARRLGAEIVVPPGFAGTARAVGGEEALVPRLVRLAAEAGLGARARRASWGDLLRLARAAAQGSVAAVLILRDGGAAVLRGATADHAGVLLADPRAGEDEVPAAIDALRLEAVWDGAVILLRRRRGADLGDAPFGLGWLVREVLTERRLFRDVALASLVMSALALVPPLAWMAIVDRVIAYRSASTLTLLAAGLVIAVLYETLLGHAQRLLVLTASARIDARLNLHVLARLLRLPLDYFERNPAGDTCFRVGQVWRVRDFLTGRLFRTLLDVAMLLVLLPVLFLMHPALTWMVLGCGVLAALVVLAFMPAVRRATARAIAAETRKHAAMVETVHGIRTVKTLALEGRQADEWDERVAEAADARLRAGRLANWPQTLITPIERFMYGGVLAVGAWLAISGDAGATVGTLMAFAMISGRVAAPLVGMAQLMQELEDVKGAVGQVSGVLNSAPERPAGAIAARPAFQGRIAFEEVTFRYPGTDAPALDRLSFEAPPGTLLGLVGRSGSGKSTVTRLLQAVSTGYSGMIKIDGTELREIDLSHLRRSMGVVLQDNFLFRGTVRENIAAGRPGMTFERITRAARLAGAEEFIERMPAGYDTFIEEGSPNLSGGQRQRLAIARALVTDPPILVLDEATSALDPESEAVVNANLLRIARGRTVVVVSHRLSSLVECDQILVLDRGRLLDAGPHREVLERCDVYRRLWQQQNRTAAPRGIPGARPVPVPVPGTLMAAPADAGTAGRQPAASAAGA